MSAKLLVLAGALVHSSGGETSLPWQVYFRGMGWPSAKAALVIWRFMVLLFLVAGFGSCAGEFNKLARANAKHQIVRNGMRWDGGRRLTAQGVFARAFMVQS